MSIIYESPSYSATRWKKTTSQNREACAIVEQLRIELLTQKTADPCHLLEAHIELAQQVNTEYDDHNIS